MRGARPPIVVALTDPGIYPHAVDRVELVETHISWVFLAGDRVVRSARFSDMGLPVPTLAMGSTFHAASVWRTHVNTANKRLMLGHAFDALGAQSVYFHTSHLNLRSQAAIERLGAQRDGILRAHRRHKDGSLRDTCTYSITAPEWPAIRERLDLRLAQPR